MNIKLTWKCEEAQLTAFRPFLPSERHCLHTRGMCDVIVINILIAIFLYFISLRGPFVEGILPSTLEY